MFALRGATQAEVNERGAILAATDELLRELIRRNDLEPERMVSCIFTCTSDLDAEFPAVAARNLGLDGLNEAFDVLARGDAVRQVVKY